MAWERPGGEGSRGGTLTAERDGPWPRGSGVTLGPGSRRLARAKREPPRQTERSPTTPQPEGRHAAGGCGGGNPQHGPTCGARDQSSQRIDGPREAGRARLHHAARVRSNRTTCGGRNIAHRSWSQQLVPIERCPRCHPDRLGDIGGSRRVRSVAEPKDQDSAPNQPAFSTISRPWKQALERMAPPEGLGQPATPSETD